MRWFAGDWHVHTALSPCADDDMTPSNIIRLAKLEGRDFLVITDHHSIGNVAACQKVGERWKVAVFAGMELETREGVHILGVFPDLAAAQAIDTWVKERLRPVKNRPEVFGNQWLFSADDEPTGQEEVLLSQSLPATLEDVVAKLQAVGALVIPAHIDRRSHGLLGHLGLWPRGFSVDAVEISHREQATALIEQFPEFRKFSWVMGSDAHWLGALVGDQFTWAWLERPDFAELKAALHGRLGRKVSLFR